MIRGRIWVRAVAAAVLLSTLAGCTIVDEFLNEGTPIAIAITSPAEGASIAATSVDVLGTIDGSEAVVSFIVRSGSYVASCATTASAFSCAAVPLTSGSNTITVTAVDAANNQDSDSVTVVRSDALTVDVVKITDVSTTGEARLSLNVVAAGPSAVSSVVAQVGTDPAVACSSTSATAFTCSDLAIASTLTTITVTATDATTATASSQIRVRGLEPTSSAGFDIVLIFYDEMYTGPQLGEFLSAADRWASHITGDVADVALSAATIPESLGPKACDFGEPEVDLAVDDLVIFATSFTDSANPGLLGSAAPCLVRTGASDYATTIAGWMQFNTVSVQSLLNDGLLDDTVLHEMGHVLGIGTTWEPSGLAIDLLEYDLGDESTICAVQEFFDVDPYYTGTSALAVWSSWGEAGVLPVEEDPTEVTPTAGRLGTQCSHWDEAALTTELMTGFLNPTNQFTALTIESLADLNYVVDSSGADPQPSALVSASSAFDIGNAEILLRPRGGIDPARAARDAGPPTTAP